MFQNIHVEPVVKAIMKGLGIGLRAATMLSLCYLDGKYHAYKAEISGSHNDPCPKANTKAIPLQATNNLFINCLLDLTLVPGFD